MRESSNPASRPLRRTLEQILRARELFGEAQALALSARISLWLHGALVLYYAVQLRVTGYAGLGAALSALTFPTLLTTLAFFRRGQLADPMAQLAVLRGLSAQSLRLGLFASRVWLSARPFSISVPLLWLCALSTERSLSAWLTFPVGVFVTWLCVAGLCIGLAGLAWLSEQFSPLRPVRTLAALLLVPALLKPAVPELPSLWHGYESWTRWVTKHVEPA